VHNIIYIDSDAIEFMNFKNRVSPYIANGKLTVQYFRYLVECIDFFGNLFRNHSFYNKDSLFKVHHDFDLCIVNFGNVSSSNNRMMEELEKLATCIEVVVTSFVPIAQDSSYTFIQKDRIGLFLQERYDFSRLHSFRGEGSGTQERPVERARIH